MATRYCAVGATWLVLMLQVQAKIGLQLSFCASYEKIGEVPKTKTGLLK